MHVIFMKNLYNFQKQITSINEICQSNIHRAEIANYYLKLMCPSVIRRIVKELKEQYQEEYLGKDEDKLNSIRHVLNLLKKEQVTNIDELYMDLIEDLKAYYEGADIVQHITCQKKKPYYLQCSKCKLSVSNHSSGLKSHQAKCPVKSKSQQSVKIQGEQSQKAQSQKKKIKKVDTEVMYEKRQNRLYEMGDVKIEEPQERSIKRPTKRQLLEQKRLRKLEEDKRRRQTRLVELRRTRDNGTNLSNQPKGSIYFEDDDDKLLNKEQEDQLANQEEQKTSQALLGCKH